MGTSALSLGIRAPGPPRLVQSRGSHADTLLGGPGDGDDTVDCGAGEQDSACADPDDDVADCESVTRT